MENKIIVEDSYIGEVRANDMLVCRCGAIFKGSELTTGKATDPNNGCARPGCDHEFLGGDIRRLTPIEEIYFDSDEVDEEGEYLSMPYSPKERSILVECRKQAKLFAQGKPLQKTIDSITRLKYGYFDAEARIYERSPGQIKDHKKYLAAIKKLSAFEGDLVEAPCGYTGKPKIGVVTKVTRVHSLQYAGRAYDVQFKNKPDLERLIRLGAPEIMIQESRKPYTRTYLPGDIKVVSKNNFRSYNRKRSY